MRWYVLVIFGQGMRRMVNLRARWHRWRVRRDRMAMLERVAATRIVITVDPLASQTFAGSTVLVNLSVEEAYLAVRYLRDDTLLLQPLTDQNRILTFRVITEKIGAPTSANPSAGA